METLQSPQVRHHQLCTTVNSARCVDRLHRESSVKRILGPALKLKPVEIARQVQWKSKQSNVHLGGGVTHQL
jgi:hypothetical protein